MRKCGNFFYVSKNALEGNAISRKDDIISVTYILLNLCIKNISWKYGNGNTEDEHIMKILKCKKKINFRDYCKGGLEEIYNINEKANQLEFEEEPNYDLYNNILKESIKKRNIKKKDNNFFAGKKR